MRDMSLCKTAFGIVGSLLVLVSALSGCATPPPPPPMTEGVPVAKGVTLVLPSPGDLGHPVEAMQMVTARHGDDLYVLEGRLSINGERLKLVGTDSLGRRAMTIDWRPGRVVVDKAPWVPDGLRPENILADIVLLYWPDPVLSEAVKGADIQSDGTSRRIGDSIQISWEGDPWRGRARLVNASFGYELDVRSVLVADTP